MVVVMMMMIKIISIYSCSNRKFWLE